MNLVRAARTGVRPCRLVGLLGLLLLPTPGWSALRVEGDRLLSEAAPLAIRGVWYPLHARRDGRPFDAPEFCDWLVRNDFNAVFATVDDGPASADAPRLLAAARERGLFVAVRPLVGDPVAWAQRLAPGPDIWIADRRVAVDALAARLTGAFSPDAGSPELDLVLASPPALYQPALGYGQWAGVLAAYRVAAARPLLVNVEAAPPDWLVSEQILRPAAPHPDLYRSTRQRPATAAANAGELLLVPEPAQLRLAAYAALGSGARGVVFDHYGHLTDGPNPYHGIDRAVEICQLAAELRRIERFMAEGTALPPPATPVGVAAALLARGDERLLVLWRDRRLDTRSVGGRLTDPFAVTVPLDNDSARAWRLAPGGVVPEPTDLRDGGLRLVVPALDLTAVWLLTPRPPTDLVDATEAALPRTAQRRLTVSSGEWVKTDATLRRLEAIGHSAGSRPLLALAAGRLSEAAQAFALGYHLTALDLALEASRIIRQARALEFETALTLPLADNQREDHRLCYAALPWLWETASATLDGPYAVAPGDPLKLGFDDLTPGVAPPRWRALAGSDQTVLTLTAVEGGADGSPRALRWAPQGPDPGILALPFTADTSAAIELSVRCLTPPAGVRLIGVAAGLDEPPFVGVALRPEGTVEGYPRGALRPLGLGDWHRVTIRSSDGRWVASWDGVPLTADDLVTPALSAGALVLVKRAGEDPTAIELDHVRITSPAPAAAPAARR